MLVFRVHKYVGVRFMWLSRLVLVLVSKHVGSRMKYLSMLVLVYSV